MSETPTFNDLRDIENRIAEEWEFGARARLIEARDRMIATAFAPSNGRGRPIVAEAPDGRLHGGGIVIASADASRVRPQDCAPIMRRLIFRDRV